MNHFYHYVFIKNSITQVDPNNIKTQNMGPPMSRSNYSL